MKRLFLALLFCASIASPLIGQTIPLLYRDADKKLMTQWVDSVFDSMSYDERIGQLFMVIGDPKTDSRNTQKLMRYVNEIKIGGILFHKGNPISQAQITNQLQKASRIPLLVAMDGEWGLSMRLSGTTRFPKNMMLGAITDNNLIRAYGAEMARQCKEMGIQINFAPDLDVNNNADNPVIGLRSFGENPYKVSEKGIAYAEGLEGEGIMSVGKHFPGHGDTNEDSHNTLPTLYRTRRQLDEVELYPFRKYIEAGFAGIMTGHLLVPALDKSSKLPVSMSRAVVTDLLQKELGFRGLCFTDALAMKGATTKKSDNPSVLALKAGNDILLAPATPINDFTAVKEAIDEGILDIEEIEAKIIKILSYKYITGVASQKPIEIKGLSERLNSPHAAALNAKLNQSAITLLKNDNHIIPLKQIDRKKIALLSIGEPINPEFKIMLNKYDTIAEFTIKRNSTAAQVQQIYNQLKKYDLIICGVNTVRIPESSELRKLASEKEMIFSFFTLPYFCNDYKQSIHKSKAVIMGYEATVLAQEYAAQAIFGGIGTKGKLPVTIEGLFPVNTGIETQPTRLGYDEPEAVGLNSQRLADIDRIAKEGIEQKAYPGCQVLVAKDGKIIYDKSFGTYDYISKQPVESNSVYDLASCSKATGTLLAVMKAYDEKKFNLNTKLGDVLPDFSNSDKNNITIKEMLYHQSGLTPSILFYRDAKDSEGFKPEYISNVVKPGFTDAVARGIYVSDSFKPVITDDIKKSRLGMKGKYAYSDINFILLKMIVEQQMHQPLDKMLNKEFLRPLGAWHTTYNPLQIMDTMQIVPTEKDDLLRKQLLRGYVHDEAAAFQGGVSGNAGLFSNANDLAKILQLYLNKGTYGGDRLLSPETVSLFTQSKSPSSRRGLGFDKPLPGNPKSSPCGLLAPPSVYGHTGYTGTCFWVDPDNQLIYIFLSNRVNPTRNNNKLGSLDIRTRIQDTIYKALQ